jgi:hypothetical protein
MLNFAEQTGSGAVMLVWSYPTLQSLHFTYLFYIATYSALRTTTVLINNNDCHPHTGTRSTQLAKNIDNGPYSKHPRLGEYLDHDIHETKILSCEMESLSSCLFLGCLVGYSYGLAKTSPIILAS